MDMFELFLECVKNSLHRSSCDHFHMSVCLSPCFYVCPPSIFTCESFSLNDWRLGKIYTFFSERSLATKKLAILSLHLSSMFTCLSFGFLKSITSIFALAWSSRRCSGRFIRWNTETIKYGKYLGVCHQSCIKLGTWEPGSYNFCPPPPQLNGSHPHLLFLQLCFPFAR